MNTIKTFKEKYGVHITTKMNGKMSGMKSLSTSSLCNPICKERAKVKSSICSHCYSNSMQAMYTNLAKALAKNSDVLMNEFIASDDWARIKDEIFRLEAFGDLANETQLLNYLEFCKANPETTFTLWTKNRHICRRVFKDHEKPVNLIIGVSSPKLNERLQINPVLDWFVDFVFTVWDFITAKEKNIKINCGNRKCFECRKCYTKQNGIFYVDEILKSEANKYYKWLANK